MKPERHVLLVDDEPLVRTALRRVLEPQGYTIFQANNGDEALAVLAEKSIHLVISDKDMPGMSGLELLKVVRDRYPRVCRVLMTGKPDLASTVLAINEGEVYRFVEKPWNRDHLLTTLHFAFETIELESALRTERDRSERLLLNVMPREIAERLKAGEAPIADHFPEATVLFSDLVNFTRVSAAMTAVDVVSLLETIFTAFDELAGSLGVEKIKTLGDGYLAVAGLPQRRPDHVAVMAEMALAMPGVLQSVNAARGTRLDMRVGLHTGPVVAGVIGVRRFSYDLWGDTVNTASRMESLSEPGRVHVTQEVRDALGDAYTFESRGLLAIKGKGQLPTHFLLGKK